MSGKFEILSGNCQGNVREFCFRWSVATLMMINVCDNYYDDDGGVVFVVEMMMR